MKLFDLINPVKIMAFFTFYGGGSGGGGSSNPDTRYSNLDALYGTQNQASQYMLDNTRSSSFPCVSAATPLATGRPN